VKEQRGPVGTGTFGEKGFPNSAGWATYPGQA
jgi:hypothetical protein